MKFHILTLFPELITSALQYGLLSQAIRKNLVEVSTLNPRDFATDVHRTVDDKPFGGGDGMIMSAEILSKTLRALDGTTKEKSHVIYLSPQGQKLNAQKAQELMKHKSLIFVCGRYGGIDQRFINKEVDEEISIGDYVLNGGELAALVCIEVISRFVPGVLGHANSAHNDSFSNHFLEAPAFTKPQEWGGQKVPPALISGHHEKIRLWQKWMEALVTFKKRPDLLFDGSGVCRLSEAEKKELILFWQGLSDEEKQACGLENLTTVKLESFDSRGSK